MVLVSRKLLPPGHIGPAGVPWCVWQPRQVMSDSGPFQCPNKRAGDGDARGPFEPNAVQLITGEDCGRNHRWGPALAREGPRGLLPTAEARAYDYPSTPVGLVHVACVTLRMALRDVNVIRVRPGQPSLLLSHFRSFVLFDWSVGSVPSPRGRSIFGVSRPLGWLGWFLL